MFEAKSQEKLHPTDLALYTNKLKLDEFQNFDPFEMTDLNGLRVLKYPLFEPYYKVIQSLKVTDEKGNFLPVQSETLKNDILKIAKHQTFLELLYIKSLSGEKEYMNLLEEKLLLNLVNLVLDKELPTDRTLEQSEIDLAKKTFKKMLKNA